MAIMLTLIALTQVEGKPFRPDASVMAGQVRRAMIVRGYDSPAPKLDYLKKRINWIIRWDRRLKVPLEAVDEQVALWIQESKFGMEPGAGHASNFGQVTFGTFPECLALIKRRGFELPKGQEGEVALAVAAYRLKLTIAKGDQWRAVYYYNGTGTRAELHVIRVGQWYQDIFGREP